MAADKKLVAELNKMDYFERCAAYGREFRKAPDSRRMRAIEALDRQSPGRMNLTPTDLANIGSGRVELNMTLCAVYAAAGIPRNVNTSEHASGTPYQLVFPNNLYVYVEGSAQNPRVKSIQR